MSEVMDTALMETWSGIVGSALRNGANAFREALSDTQIAEFVASYDFIVAVFPDPAGPTGLQFLPVKGWDLWKRVAEGEQRDLRCNSMPCPDRDAAVTWLMRFGDPAWLEELSSPQKPPTIN